MTDRKLSIVFDECPIIVKAVSASQSSTPNAQHSFIARAVPHSNTSSNHYFLENSSKYHSSGQLKGKKIHRKNGSVEGFDFEVMANSRDKNMSMYQDKMQLSQSNHHLQKNSISYKTLNDMAEFKQSPKKAATNRLKIRKGSEINLYSRRSHEASTCGGESLYRTKDLEHKPVLQDLREYATKIALITGKVKPFTDRKVSVCMHELNIEAEGRAKKSFLQHLPDIMKQKRSTGQGFSSWSESCLQIRKAGISKTNDKKCNYSSYGGFDYATLPRSSLRESSTQMSFSTPLKTAIKLRNKSPPVMSLESFEETFLQERMKPRIL
eukprot:CAMPEP_0204916804 /NCGR_PEP_ID=MMETSP1397-20131031/14535_1 /ASSEMBLY_ACC=CAM_ASM_000891 /TAXON_ID=49980 /ORGANISM="Climacostomum Climacostomum virens, Strain Stock W-24" /LENGTH=322 /DNA_ID=CAMNT_0052089447 /DNA_START=226 /DNA_END=1194 /DNA_ORIENTATION=-